MTKLIADWPLEFCDPEEVGFSSERLKRVSTHMQKFLDDKIFAGGIALAVRNGKIAHLECYGMADLEKGIPMRDDALFRIYSMTKLVTSVAVMILYEQVHFMLDDPVKRFIPEFGNLKVEEKTSDGKSKLVELKRDITIHDLDPSTDLGTFVKEFCKEPLINQPGIKWDYSASTDVLGHLIQVISGKPLDVFFKEEIFEPLGMTDTDFYVSKEKQARLAQLYTHDDNKQLIPKGKVSQEFFKKHNLMSGGGGLISSTSDFLRFSLMMLNKGIFNDAQILSPLTLELMTVDHLPKGHAPIDPFGFGFGLGVSVIRSLGEKHSNSSVGEFGWGGAACTEEWIDPKLNMISMSMMQLMSTYKIMFNKYIRQAYYQAITKVDI